MVLDQRGNIMLQISFQVMSVCTFLLGVFPSTSPTIGAGALIAAGLFAVASAIASRN